MHWGGGEALWVGLGVDKTRHYVMGCSQLYVGVDHKPLQGIYSPKRDLTDIDNPRMRRLAEKATR